MARTWKRIEHEIDDLAFYNITNLFSNIQYLFPLTIAKQLTKIVALAFVASASAFVPAANTRMPSKLYFEYGEYDDKLWDTDAKNDVYAKWDPASPRSAKNFNPYETYKGNSCDCSGIYPGEVRSICFVFTTCCIK